MAKVKVRPLRDRILVKRIEEKEKKVGGIIIPDSAKEKPQEAEVVAVGNSDSLVTDTTTERFMVREYMPGVLSRRRVVPPGGRPGPETTGRRGDSTGDPLWHDFCLCQVVPCRGGFSAIRSGDGACRFRSRASASCRAGLCHHRHRAGVVVPVVIGRHYPHRVIVTRPVYVHRHHHHGWVVRVKGHARPIRIRPGLVDVGAAR